MAIDAALPHPEAVAITSPSTSPIAHPVKQCSVARTAVRVSESVAASATPCETCSTIEARWPTQSCRRRLSSVDGVRDHLHEVGCRVEGCCVARPFDSTRRRARNRSGKQSHEAGHVVGTPCAEAAYDRDSNRREISPRRIDADRVPEVHEGDPCVLPPGPAPLLREGVPRASTVTVGVRGTEQRLGGLAVSASQRKKRDLGERCDL